MFECTSINVLFYLTKCSIHKITNRKPPNPRIAAGCISTILLAPALLPVGDATVWVELLPLGITSVVDVTIDGTVYVVEELADGIAIADEEAIVEAAVAMRLIAVVLLPVTENSVVVVVASCCPLVDWVV